VVVARFILFFSETPCANITIHLVAGALTMIIKPAFTAPQMERNGEKAGSN